MQRIECIATGQFQPLSAVTARMRLDAHLVAATLAKNRLKQVLLFQGMRDDQFRWRLALAKILT